MTDYQPHFAWVDHVAGDSYGYAQCQMDGFAVRVDLEMDEDYGTGNYGVFTGKWEEGAIPSYDDFIPHGSYKWFVPANSIAEAEHYYITSGRSEDVAHGIALEQAREDRERAKVIGYIPVLIVVKASLRGVVLGHTLRGGYELEGTPAVDYIDSDAWELAQEAVDEAKKKLAEIVADAKERA